ncbi:MAG: HAMP domain-containing histidine kinase, partial [Bacteroidota bacterium]|nr:HAMP domain-containing histidine kinase [Bacteroidota bacterium]
MIIIVLVSITSFINLDKSSILLITLFATLLASGITLYLLNKLLTPLHQAKNALRAYRSEGVLPDLPTQFEDEAGILLKELQYSLEQLDYLIHEKKDIIRLLSQDIRSPYQQIYELARRIPVETDPLLKNDGADQIKEITISNLLVLQDILKLLEFEEEGVMDHQQLDINDLVRETITRLSPAAAIKSISIKQDLAPEPVFVNGSRLLLTEAISQLLYNAIKFSFPNGVIRARTANLKEMIQLTVEDQGLGVEEAEKELIFQRFTLARKRGTSGEYG